MKKASVGQNNNKNNDNNTSEKTNPGDGGHSRSYLPEPTHITVSSQTPRSPQAPRGVGLSASLGQDEAKSSSYYHGRGVGVDRINPHENVHAHQNVNHHNHYVHGKLDFSHLSHHHPHTQAHKGTGEDAVAARGTGIFSGTSPSRSPAVITTPTGVADDMCVTASESNSIKSPLYFTQSMSELGRRFIRNISSPRHNQKLNIPKVKKTSLKFSMFDQEKFNPNRYHYGRTRSDPNLRYMISKKAKEYEYDLQSRAIPSLQKHGSYDPKVMHDRVSLELGNLAGGQANTATNNVNMRFDVGSLVDAFYKKSRDMTVNGPGGVDITQYLMQKKYEETHHDHHGSAQTEKNRNQNQRNRKMQDILMKNIANVSSSYPGNDTYSKEMLVVLRNLGLNLERAIRSENPDDRYLKYFHQLAESNTALSKSNSKETTHATDETKHGDLCSQIEVDESNTDRDQHKSMAEEKTELDTSLLAVRNDLRMSTKLRKRKSTSRTITRLLRDSQLLDYLEHDHRPGFDPEDARVVHDETDPGKRSPSKDNTTHESTAMNRNGSATSECNVIQQVAPLVSKSEPLNSGFDVSKKHDIPRSVSLKNDFCAVEEKPKKLSIVFERSSSSSRVHSRNSFAGKFLQKETKKTSNNNFTGFIMKGLKKSESYKRLSGQER